MAEVYKVQIEDENGNIHYPHTTADVVFLSDNTSIEKNIIAMQEQMERYSNISVEGEILKLPGSDTIAVSGETLTLPLGI